MAEFSKSWFLKELINLNAFATSASGLAKMIGYKGKGQMYRILNDKAGEGTISEVWRRIREEYYLTDDELCAYVDAIRKARQLWKKVQDKAASQNEDVRALAEQILHALMIKEEEGVRRVMSFADWQMLLDYSREQPMQYAQMIVIYYILYNGIEQAYRGDLSRQGLCLLNGLYVQMHALQPENRMLNDMADAYRSELRQMTGMGNLWTISLRPTLFVQSFTDPNYRINTLSNLRLLPVSTDSLWMDHDTLAGDSGLAYIFFEVEPDGATGGRYDCIEVEAVASTTELAAKRCFAFWMMEPEEGEDYTLAFIQFRDEHGEKQIVRYVYEYDQTRQNLHLEPLDTDSPNCVNFPFPTDLHWVDNRHLIMEEERQWIAWYDRFMATHEEQLYLEMMKSEGIMLEENYEIIDVAISRKYLTVTISNGTDETTLRAELEKHPGLKIVEPRMDVTICKHLDDQQLYLEWISPHISVPIEAFDRLN